MLKLLAVLNALTFISLTFAQTGQIVRGVWRVPGDIMIGFVVAAHDNNASMTVAYDARYACGALNPSAALLVPAFAQAVKAINDRSAQMGGLTIGYDVIDSCKLPTHAVDLASPWAIAKVMRLSDPSQAPPPPIIAIGAFNSRVTAPLAVMLQQFDIPLIDYASTSTDLSDRRRYPLYARVSPSDKHQALAISVLAKKMNYDCVHLVFSEGLYGELGAADLRRELSKLGVCVKTNQIAPAVETSDATATFDKIVSNINAVSTAKSVICFCEDTTARSLMRSIRSAAGRTASQLQLILSDFSGTSLDLTGLESVAENAITVTINASPATLDATAYTTLARNAANQDPYFQELLSNRFKCTFDAAKVSASLPRCNPSTFTLTAADLPVNTFLGAMQLSVKAVGDSIGQWINISCAGFENKTDCLPQINAGQAAYELYSLVLGARSGSGANLFDKNGDGQPNYQFNWYSANNSPSRYVAIATWTASTALATNANFVRYPKVTSTCTTC